MQIFAPEILDSYVEGYKLQIQTIELCKTCNIHEQKFLFFIIENICKLISLIENYIKTCKKYDDSFVYLKSELDNSLKNSHLMKIQSNTQNIYIKFQNLLNDIEKTLKLAK